MLRRDFIAWMTAGLTSTTLHAVQKKKTKAKRPASRSRSNAKLERIGVSSWSFHDYFAKTRRKDFDQPGPLLALLDFPEMVADRYKVHHLEFVAPHFASTEPAYIQELRSRLQRSHSHLVNIPVDIKEIWTAGGLSDPDSKVRESVIQAAREWIDIASKMGARSVRCDPGQFNLEDLAPTIDSYRKLAAYGKAKGIRVIVENHGKVGSEHPEALINIFKAVKSEFFGALPDFGNFADEETRERALPLLFPYAKTVCHAKGLEFDSSGNETKFDFRKCVEISKQAKFKGVYSIEYEGHGDPYEGVQKVVDELLRFL